MRLNHYALLILISVLSGACDDQFKKSSDNQSSVQFQNKGHELVYEMVQKVGMYSELTKRRSVEYIYTYRTPNGLVDSVSEKYYFDGELSYGCYHRHQRTLPEFEGVIEQGYDGNEFWLKNQENVIEDERVLEQVKFNRHTNFYWFCMMSKLLDPGLKYEWGGEFTQNGLVYDIVKVTFSSDDGSPTDIYQLYINRKTRLVDQFLFTVVDKGVVETPFIMQLEYEKVDGLLIPTVRRYKKSTWQCEINDDPWINVQWSNIRFNTGLTPDHFKRTNDMMEKETKTLRSQLNERKENFNLRADDHKKAVYRDGIESVRNSGIIESAKQIGEQAPDFTLTNAIGETVSLSDYLKKGKVILTWYRGNWCPYCNLTLRELQNELSEFSKYGAHLIALTPELPDESITTAEKHELEFEVLSDVGNKVAEQYGIVFELTEEVAEMYNKSFQLNDHNGDKSNQLPLAATYVIDQSGKIIYAFLDADYRNRAEPSELTQVLINHQ